MALSPLASLTAAFRAIRVDGAARQMGRRYCRDAAALGDRNPERVDFLLGRAALLLPQAQEVARRAQA